MPLVLENIILNQDWGTTIYYPGFFIEKIKGTQYSNDQEVLDLTNSIEGPEGYIAVPIEEDIN